MNRHEAPDTNLIQKGVIVAKQRNEKYLKRDAVGIWHLNFRVPVRFGGKLIRQSLFTEDFNVAASIRDRFVVPILALGLPILDTLMAIIRRTLRHQSIGTADKEHLHHRILRAGFGQRRAVLLMYSLSGIMGIVAILYSRDLFIECLGLAFVAALILGVILTDTGTNKVSLKGYRILKELPDAPVTKTEQKAVNIAEEEAAEAEAKAAEQANRKE